MTYMPREPREIREPRAALDMLYVPGSTGARTLNLSVADVIFISFDSIVCRIMAVSEELEVGIRASIFVEKVVRASSRLSS